MGFETPLQGELPQPAGEGLLGSEQHLNELMPQKWLLGSNAVDIICVIMKE